VRSLDGPRATDIAAAEIDALTVPQQIAIAMRVLERGGCCQDAAGQIVVRNPERAGTYYTNAWGFTWEAPRATDVLLIDEHMQVLEGRPGLAPSGSLELQFGILRARPDVQAVLHNHPPLATAWSATRRPVRPLDQTSSIFFERQAWCAEFEDIEHLYDPAYFGRTGEALGPQAHVLWMVHHGVIVAHRSIPYATIYALYLERSVQLELWLAQAGGAAPLDDAVAAKMRDMLQTAFVIPDSWRALARSTLAHDPDVVN
jgi:L-fuculose-phosphate aldolase